MTRFANRTFAAALLVLAACNEPPQAPVPAAVRVGATHVWAGDTLRLYSAGFAAQHDVLVRLDGDSILVIRENDSTAAIVLPLQAADYVLSVEGTGVELTDAMVHSHGFRSRRSGPPVQGDILPYPLHSPMYLAGEDSGFSIINAYSGQRTAMFPVTVHDPRCSRGPGPSYDPAMIVGTPGTGVNFQCTGRRAWRLQPLPPQAGDSVPGSGWHVAQLSPQVWFYAAHHWVCLTGPAAVPCSPSNSLEEAGTPRISPRGDRAVSPATRGTVGLPVWDALTGAVAFTFSAADYISILSVAFSGSGDTLFAFMRPSGTADSTVLLALDATTGAVLRSIRVDMPGSGFIQDAMVTADGRRLLWLATQGGGVQLLVFRLPELTQEALVRSPPDVCPQGCGDMRLLGSGTPVLFAADGSGTDYWESLHRYWQSTILTFDLTP